MADIAVVALSGGMDSCVVTAMTHAIGMELALLHGDYGQRTETRERQAFRAIADHFDVPVERRLVIDFTALRAIGGSSLTDTAIAVPEGNLHQLGIPNTYVPFRNAHLLSACTSWGEVLQARAVVVGFVEEDSSGYPDCREAFFRAFEVVANLGTRPETRLAFHAPLLHLRKADIVRKGLQLGAPLHLSWSCYQGEDLACGRCDSCRLRLKGFRDAGIRDPIPYLAGSDLPQDRRP
jgi:7-cyano-7-deazaguanine synthase